MKLTDADLRQLYEESTAPRDTAACLDVDVLIRAAGKRLGHAEREAAADHIARCSECARGYRIARSMQTFTAWPAAPRRGWTFAAGAIAATLLLFLPAVTWLVVLRERDRAAIAELQGALLERGRAKPAVPQAPPDQTAELTRPQLDAPIVDLDSDVTRGAEDAARIVVPPDVDLFTTILHLDEPARGPIEVSIEGPARWSGSWQAETAAATVTLTLHRRRFPAGEYVVRTRAGGREASYRFRVEWR